jgi:fructokinase
MSRHIVVGLGEVLWDIFPDGKRLGGAPANCAYHAEVLGEEGIIVSRVGEDELGSALVGQLDDRGLNTDYIQRDPLASTGTVNVTIVDDEPSFSISADVAWDRLEWGFELAVLATRCDAVCYSTLCQRNEVTRGTVETFLKSVKPEALRVLDVNLRPPFFDTEVIDRSIELAGIVKYNQQEGLALAKMFGVEHLAEWLIDLRGVDVIFETRGADGCLVQTSEGATEISGVRVDTSQGDAVGVGDAFTAAVIHELLRGATPQHAARFANRYAAIVAKKRGGMPEMMLGS